MAWRVIHQRGTGKRLGGEQQRTSIARALATKPAVVLADEPTGNLDTENAAQVADMLRLAAETYDQTIVMVTHDNQMAEYAHRIIRIADGVVEG
jgi:putative ABC transport system ATP-binding protein